MNNYFKRPEDLTSKGFTQAQDLSSNNTLKPASDLTPNNDNGYLKPAGDISTSNNTQNVGYNAFKPARDISQSENSIEEINEYLKEIQTGQRTYGPILGGAKMFVPLDKLKQMVNDGYNIISAKYFEQMQIIEVEFDIPTKSKTR